MSNNQDENWKVIFFLGSVSGLFVFSWRIQAVDHYEDVEDETEYEGLHAELLLRQVSQVSLLLF